MLLFDNVTVCYCVPAEKTTTVAPSVTAVEGGKDTSQSVDDENMMWLKTTVYTVIACTVGIVLLISIVVIAIFRIKMKRAAERRAMRQAERRRRHHHRCENHHGHGPSGGSSGSRSQRVECGMEHEPFISTPSPTHFGNIIVNVNNGVQYVPSVELNAVLQAPPPYSEVMAQSIVDMDGRNSPPPEYSTIDRNPNRTSQLPPQVDIELHVRASEITESAVCAGNSTPNSDNVTTSCSHGDMQLVDDSSYEQREQVINTRQPSRQFNPSEMSSVTCTNSLGRQSESHSRGGRHGRNVRSVGSPRRPKQLKVLGGEIMLDGQSSPSSSPETVTRNTQTNPADLSVARTPEAAKPPQLQVHGGQIILAAEGGPGVGSGDPAVTTSSEVTPGSGVVSAVTPGSEVMEGEPNCQGQLEVKDGQIVFKSSTVS